MSVIELETERDIEITDALLIGTEGLPYADVLNGLLVQPWRVQHKGKWWLAFGPTHTIESKRDPVRETTVFHVTRKVARPTKNLNYPIGKLTHVVLEDAFSEAITEDVMKRMRELLEMPSPFIAPTPIEAPYVIKPPLPMPLVPAYEYIWKTEEDGMWTVTAIPSGTIKADTTLTAPVAPRTDVRYTEEEPMKIEVKTSGGTTRARWRPSDIWRHRKPVEKDHE